MAFNFFKKLFRKNKNTIKLTAEEAYGSAAVEEVPAPAPVREDISGTEAEPSQSFRTVLYACLDDPDTVATKIRSVMSDSFISVTENGEGYSGLLTENVRTSVTLEIDEDCAPGLALRAEFEKSTLPDKDVIHAALMQMALFDVKMILVSSGNGENAGIAHDALIRSLTSALRGFYLKEDGLYRWDGKLLTDKQGNTDLTVFMPVRCTSGSEGAAIDPSVARMNHTMSILQSKGITVPCDAPVQLDEKNVELRPVEDIVGRAAALLLTSLTAMAYTTPSEYASPSSWSMALAEKMDRQYAVKSYLTNKEKAYLARPTPDKHESFLAGSEACAMLLWGIGLTDPGWPSQKTDLRALSDLFKTGSYSLMLKLARPRESAVLADMHDLIRRLHYATVFSPAEELEKTQVDADVVYERHYAINWMLGVDGITSWDNVIPRT